MKILPSSIRIQVIVISKEHPVQLEACLLSLFQLTKVREENTTVLYSGNTLDYKRLAKKWSRAKFVDNASVTVTPAPGDKVNKRFSVAYKSTLSSYYSHVLTLIDDVLFYKNIDLNAICQTLRHNQNYVFSPLFLGSNIKGMDLDTVKTFNTDATTLTNRLLIACSIFRISDYWEFINECDEYESPRTLCRSMFHYMKRKCMGRPVLLPDISAAFVHPVNILTLCKSSKRGEYISRNNALITDVRNGKTLDLKSLYALTEKMGVDNVFYTYTLGVTEK